MPIVRLAALLIAIAIAVPARAESWWLVVGGSQSSPAEAAHGGWPTYPPGFLIQTAECGYADNRFAWVLHARRSDKSAQDELSRLPEHWGKAYLLRCDVQRHSLISWGIGPVDESIAGVPDDAMTWTDRDRVSSVYPLPDGRTAIVVRTFDPKRRHIDEGKRVKVLLGPAFGDLLVLTDDCPDAGGFAVQDGLVALHCRSLARPGFHDVRLFDRHGKSVFHFERCRDPAWAGQRILSCQEEVLSAEDGVTLRTKSIALTPGIVPAPAAERLWLAVALKGLSPQEIAVRAKDLAEEFPAGMAVRMSDCGGPDDQLAWAAEASPVKEVAEATLIRLRTMSGDAQILSCDAGRGTLLYHRVSAIDPSIAEIPEGESDYWNDADKVSATHPLSDGLTIILVRYYEPELSHELPGRIERVLLGLSHGGRRVLEDSCFDAGGFVNEKGLVAFHCMDYSIAHLPFHAVRAFDQLGNRMVHIPRCRDAVISGDDRIACQSISYTEDGELRLQAKYTRF